MVGPGIESLWGRDFPHTSIPALRPPPIQRVPSVFPGRNATRARRSSPTPPSSEVKEIVEITPPPLQAFMACCMVNFVFTLPPLLCILSLSVSNILQDHLALGGVGLDAEYFGTWRKAFRSNMTPSSSCCPCFPIAKTSSSWGIPFS